MPSHYNHAKKGSPTPSLDMPQPVGKLFDFALEPEPGAAAPAGGLNLDNRVGVSGMTPGAGPVPGYADGGLVQPGGAAPVDTGVAPGGPGLAAPGGGAPAPGGGGGDLEAKAKQMMREQPAMAAQMLKAAQDAIEMGEFTEEMIVTGGKMAIVVARNPEMYPKMYERLTAMGAKDIPAEYDPGFIFTVIAMYLAWQQKDQIQAGGVAGDVGGTGDDGVQDFRDGGYVTHGSKAKGGGAVVGMGGPRDDMIRADLSNGEFVIPAHAVRDKGVDHFQKNYIDKYKAPKDAEMA